jgi:hypothetical protein
MENGPKEDISKLSIDNHLVQNSLLLHLLAEILLTWALRKQPFS